MLEVLYPILLAVAVADAVMCLVGWLAGQAPGKREAPLTEWSP